MKFMVKDKRKFNMVILGLLVAIIAIYSANILL
jgi:hypothetical protein